MNCLCEVLHTELSTHSKPCVAGVEVLISRSRGPNLGLIGRLEAGETRGSGGSEVSRKPLSRVPAAPAGLALHLRSEVLAAGNQKRPVTCPRIPRNGQDSLLTLWDPIIGQGHCRSPGVTGVQSLEGEGVSVKG